VWQSSPPRWFTRSLLWLTDSAQILNVATNLLTELPKEIVCLTNLRDLDVAQNQLTSLLPEIGLLKTLEELKVSLRCFPRREDFEILQFRVISD
jgi:Leucine-rich repeat (LRR) protein